MTATHYLKGKEVKTMKPNKAKLRMWVNALRSGDYKRSDGYLKGKEVKAKKHFLLSRPGKWENGFWTGLLVGALVIFLVVNAVWIWL